MHSKHPHSLKRSFTEFNTSNPIDMPLNNGHGDPSSSPSASSNSSNFIPRNYQVKVFEVARKRNTIAVLETGAGKTMIAVMLIQDIFPVIKANIHKKLIIFLAPTVHLVHQQYDVIKINTDCEVEKYYGAKGVDEWNLKCWEKEINQYDVLVMTPQILLDALRKAFLSLKMVSFIIIDECHRATGNHPYTKIMKEFYHKSDIKPKIFGMTASPVIRKGVSSVKDCEGQLSELESILDSQIYTIEDKTEMEVYAPSATESCKYYNPSRFCSSDLKEKMGISWKKFDASLSKLEGSVQNCYKDMNEKHDTLRRRLSNYHAKILYSLDELGIICAYEAVKICLENAPKSKECEIYRESSSQCKLFLEEMLCIIGESLPMGDEDFLDFGFDYSMAVDLGYISPKLHELLQLFLSFGRSTEVLCLIFVERIMAAKVVERFVKKVTCLDHFTVSYLTGSNTSVDAQAPKLQRETLESFRSGKINLLFATDVVEEGIHVPNCSCVIRFDLPKTVRSYVQSRGRARQYKSQFFVMLERGNMKHRNSLFDIIRSEYSMTDTALKRDPDACILKACTFEKPNTYIVNTTGASVTADSSVSLIHRYCEKLPGDKYYTPRPIFNYKKTEGFFVCEMTLPANAAFQTIVGPASSNKNLSKQLVCLEACKNLHQMGALDDHLLPFVEETFENNLIREIKESAPGAGTTKRKELHGTTPVTALCGSWGENIDGVIFHAYKFDFSCSIVSEVYSGFILLIESKLDDDVGNYELDLYLVSKMVKTTVSSCGLVQLDPEQVSKAKCFQEFFFNGLFGKLFVKCKSTGRREFLLQNETKPLWNPSNMYLLLPLESSSSQESLRISWTEINACASAVEFLKKNNFLGAIHRNGYGENLSPSWTNSPETECKRTSIIKLVNVSADTDNLKDRVVFAIHTGKIYSVVEVLSDASAESPFDGMADVVLPEYTSFVDYFHKKYGIVLRHPKQPLLRLKQSHNAHNLLVNFADEGATGKASQAKKPEMHIYMPPELLACIDVSQDVLKSFYLLPSLMQRLESLMLASQLRGVIGCHSGNFQIPSSMILEAITTLRCAETFSMERLELLGDSVLKYAVSCHLFLTYPKKHEGQLSARRSWTVCNSTLYKFGTDRKLQGYIRDSAFDPRRWVAPGQISLRPVPCKCGVDTLEVPLDANFFTTDTKVVVGKLCDMGHRWMGSKTIADCVEALIGAYYVGGGLVAALHMMKWLGIDVELEPSLVLEAITSASLRSYAPKTNVLKDIELKIGYEFSVKFLLQEAITHASESEFYCYQRLEFLGDSVLDLLITWHLYQSHTDIDPGELTDLRSASVNNESFAQVAVRHNLHKHLQHCSTVLLSQISEYVKSFPEPSDTTSSGPDIKGPKALGDLVESIVGAMLIDTKLNLEKVWTVFKPLLSPIVTPDKLELPPLRELTELCDSLGYFIKEKCVRKGEIVHAELRLQLEDVLLVEEGDDQKKKGAKGKAASKLLKELEKRGISKGVSKARKPGSDHFSDSSSLDLDSNVFRETDNDLPEPPIHKKHKRTENHVPVSESSKKAGSPTAIPILAPINMKKGGPRTSLHQLCKTLLWPVPKFDTVEHKSRTLIDIGEGSAMRKGFNIFTSKITLLIPSFGTVECTGEARATKGDSFDSASLAMLHELERQGKVIIGDS